jgi:hypothetical protein
MIRLISHEKCPPGEFYYTQSEGLSKKFANTPLIGELATKIASFRAANKLARSTVSDALQDIDAFTCARLGNNPDWCYNTDQTVQAAHHGGGGCKTCGAKIA